VLWALENEVPAEVGEDNQCWHERSLELGYVASANVCRRES
jgi:hypothetical protein